tara:strand:- start:1077 stop:2381 length:1305 start_codon:yes stop_codon:yes gene_type:complete
MTNSIEIENLSKEYTLGIVGTGTLYRDLQSFWAKLRGQEDPNSLISSNNQNLHKSKILSLNSINLNVKQGEVLGIIGSNGAGKSTLLKVISRITSPTKGTIRILGRLGSLLEVGTGFHPELTGKENIYLTGAINGMRKYEIDNKYNDIVNFSGLKKFIDTPVKRYSTGMQIRLGFSVSTHLDPDVLLVDEVLAVGDASFVKQAINKMSDISSKKGRTVFFVSHNMESVRRLCSRVILLANGRIAADGEPNKIIDYYLSSSTAENSRSSISIPRNKKKKFQIIKFGILDKENKESNYLNRTENFTIFIDYEINEKIDDLGVFFSINTVNESSGVPSNTSIIQWSDLHYSRLIKKPDFINKNKGKYSSFINFPGYLLNDGNYKLKVYLGNTFENYDLVKDELNFELVDYDSCYKQENGNRCAGVLATPLNWENINR